MFFRVALIIITAFMFGWNSAGAETVLTWQDCLKEAAQKHPDLIAANEVVYQSKDNKTIAASSLFPQLDADGKIAFARSKSSGSTKNYSYGLGGTQLIFDGFNTVYQIRSAKENIVVSRQSFQFVSSQIRWRLRTAFIDVLKAQNLIELSEDIYKIRSKKLEHAIGRR